MEKVVLIRYEGDAQAEAEAVHRAISDRDQLPVDEPAPVGRADGAALGFGTVVVTLILTALGKRYLKLALDRLERYLRETWASNSSASRPRIELSAEDPENKTAKKYPLQPEQETSSLLHVIGEIRAIVNEL